MGFEERHRGDRQVERAVKPRRTHQTLLYGSYSSRVRGSVQGVAGATLLVAVPLMLSAEGQSPPGKLAKIRSSLAERMEEERLPSLAVGVARGDEILWQEAFGWADRESGARATVHTAYSLASVTKPFTATLLMVQVERGEIALEHPVVDYLGEPLLRALPKRIAAATVRSVASHTAGLPLHYHFFPTGGPPPPPMADTLRRHGVLLSEPGSEYSYSNLGYGVLELALERVVGQPYAALLERDLAEPLGLEHTSVLLDPRAAPERARRYDRSGESLPFYDFDHRGASAVWSCVHDLLRFGQSHLGRKTAGAVPILERRTLDRMQQPLVPVPEGGAYGIGWRVRDRRGHRLLGHTGGMPGVSASLLLVPADRVVIAVLANARTDLVVELNDEILETLLPRRSLSPPGTLSSPLPPASPPRLRRRRRLPRPLRGRWRGVGEWPGGSLALRLQARPDGPTLAVGDRPPLPLEDLRASRRRFSGIVMVELEPGAGPQRLQLQLELHEGALRGGLNVLSPPGARFPSALTRWVELELASPLAQ